MQALDPMLARLQQVLDTDPARATCATGCRPHADALAARLPLVHRTALPNGPPLATILTDRHLRTQPACTTREHDCGVLRALYFFLGCAAYPEGAAAFLARNHVLAQTAASFTPFDTGSLQHYARLRDAAPWADPDKHTFLATHLACATAALDFSAAYLSAHFHDADDYVRRPQTSEPDYPTYHGLTSDTGDRRAWSIEVQLHADLPLDVHHIEAIVLGEPDLFIDLPDDLAAIAVIAENPGEIAATIHHLILGEPRA